VVQNAANSGVGRWVIAFAKTRGLKTVNIVRRPELVAELEAIGGDVVVVDSPDVSERIKAAVGQAELRLALAIRQGVDLGRGRSKIQPVDPVAVWEPVSRGHSLLTGKFAANPIKRGGRARVFLAFSKVWRLFPSSTSREFFALEQGKFLPLHGTSENALTRGRRKIPTISPDRCE
jgi:hypothetical protein